MTAGDCHLTATNAMDEEWFYPGVDFETPDPDCELAEGWAPPVIHVQ